MNSSDYEKTHEIGIGERIRTGFLTFALMVIFTLYYGFEGTARASSLVTCSMESIAQQDNPHTILSWHRARSLDLNHRKCGDLLLAQHTKSIPVTTSWRGIALLHLEDDLGARGYGTPAAVDSLERARGLGVNSISLRVPGRQASVADPLITFGRENPGGETDLVVRRTIRDAHLLGLRVLLKPHVMLERITGNEWRGTIAYDSSEDLDRWWQSYSEFILHYARFAEEEEVAAFSVGVELRAMVAVAPERWSQLISKVREVYSGKLTYAANWYYEYLEVPFWEELDFIGVQFFFPLSESANPTLKELRNGIMPIVTRLQQLATTYQRPILLTEVGYKSVQGTTLEPWQWPDFNATPDFAIQAKAYQAILESFPEESWFSGLLWWNWLTESEPGNKFRHGFTPQGKEAEKVLEKYWGA